jgi:hypothetical protein
MSIPLELRLQIYDYALSDVTIAVAEEESNLFDSGIDVDGEIEGVPRRYKPLVMNEYAADMVMVGPPPVAPSSGLFESSSLSRIGTQNSLAGVSMDSGYASAGSSMYSIASTSTIDLTLPSKNAPAPAVTNITLLQVNKQMREEMLSQLKSRTCKQTTVYATYPYGVLVLRKHYAALLKYTKHIVITGQYTSPEDLASPTASSPSPPTDPTQEAAAKALSLLTRSLYKSYRKVEPQQFYNSMPTFHMRIYFPDERRYASIWQQDSPIPVAMQCIPAGQVECKTWRGRSGNGVTLRAQPPTKNQDEWHKNFSCVFRRLRQQRTCIRPARRDLRRTEEFWEDAFGDERMFEAVVPEATAWNRM